MSDTALLFEDDPLTNPSELVFGFTHAYVPVDLVFNSAPIGNPTDLVFGGDTEAPVIDDVFANVAVTMPSTTVSATASYASDTSRPIVGKVSTSWQVAVKTSSAVTTGSRPMKRMPLGAQTRWTTAKRNVEGVTSILKNTMHREHTSALSKFQDAAPLRNSFTSSFQSMRPIARASRQTGWQDAIPLRTEIQNSFQSMRPIARASRQTGWQDAVRLQHGTTTGFQKAKPLFVNEKDLFQKARRPPAGTSGGNVPPIGNPCYTPPNGLHVDLLFSTAWNGSTNLLFRCDHDTPTPGGPIVVPIRRAYIVVNNSELTRVSDGAPVPTDNMSLKIDMDSWTWGFSASMPYTSYELIKRDSSGDPVVLNAKINGHSYRILAETISRDRTFGKTSISLSGRGISANLGDPYSPVLGFHNGITRTAQQLMVGALQLNGVPIGWDVDWQIDDWLVPSGSWVHQGTYMSAITTIANAAGAFVQPDPVTQTLHILSRNKVKPWELNDSTPDIILPSAPIIQEQESWEDRAEYNSVYVSGSTTGGVLGFVRRAGSDGASPAPMVTDALITNVIAARQRGISELSKFGRVKKYQLSLPVLEETGLILPGKTVRYTSDGITATGVVNSMSVNVALPTARQTIGITTYV
ncbi:hypothetical protein ACO0LM_11800 [Undibacterium sp. Di26W]|uniref:hypothetical protein n=1 Tax=Undibacterium sp. Di26W TaxID=3413035 RepID=UPI003BEFAE83